jgi:crotonobetainyl-CoA:carnitine CoA-transferase CaiB-like acyl-CoA transferase
LDEQQLPQEEMSVVARTVARNPSARSQPILSSFVGHPPTLGEHTREVLTRVVGLDKSAIDDLKRAGAI